MAGGAIALILVLVAATAFGLWWQRRNGRMRTPRAAAGGGPRLTEAQLGAPLGSDATLLQFSSEFCAPCRAARAVLADVATQAQGVTHIEVDVADRLDLVRLLDVRRTPTVFVLGADGSIARQTSGQLRRAEVLAAVTEASGGSDSGPGRA